MTKRTKLSRSTDSAASQKSKRASTEIRKSKFKVGQVVCLSELQFYANNLERRKQLYQVITEIRPWSATYPGYGLTFANGDKCHEKWVRPLTKHEAGA